MSLSGTIPENIGEWNVQNVERLIREWSNKYEIIHRQIYFLLILDFIWNVALLRKVITLFVLSWIFVKFHNLKNSVLQLEIDFLIFIWNFSTCKRWNFKRPTFS